MAQRKLDPSEIQQLVAQGCQSDNWNTISVVQDFKTENIRNVYFSGKIELGIYDSPKDSVIENFHMAGLRNAYIKNCTIKDNVSISDVKSLVNYTIENDVVIENVDRFIVDGETTFANGLEVDALNEGGGREVPIFDQLTSQIAYLLSTYRHDQKFIQNLKAIINDYVQSKNSTTGCVDRGAMIVDCGQIKNVHIGAYSKITGALELTEGTIVSNKEAPVTIGSGVIAKSFIVNSGSIINNAALIEKTYVGQGVQVGRQFSAENTLIFANSECFHSEACSIYAGPYTVTHHKSTLLIAAMFSFYNAGSGSNQSNHMYKLGPVHQGILERGAKTGSFSYMFWPSRIGAFSVVIGKHYSNFDNTNLPFSYILESAGKTIVIPALNFFTVGTKRDSTKWPKRDRRTDSNKLDILNFDLLSPYIIGKVLKAEEILLGQKGDSPQNEKYIIFEGQLIERKRIDKSLTDYRIIIDLFIGEKVIKRLLSLADIDSFEDLKQELKTDNEGATDHWVDLSGMFCPSLKIDSLMDMVKSKSIDTVEKIRNFLDTVHKKYDQLSWEWCVNLINIRYKIETNQLSTEILKKIIETWKKAAEETNQRIIKDAEKEFAGKSRIGYGIDGDSQCRDKDFENVVGNFDENGFVKSLKEEIEEIEQTAEKMISFLKSLKI